MIIINGSVALCDGVCLHSRLRNDLTQHYAFCAVAELVKMIGGPVAVLALATTLSKVCI